jgi:hypothetical protein
VALTTSSGMTTATGLQAGQPASFRQEPTSLAPSALLTHTRLSSLPSCGQRAGFPRRPPITWCAPTITPTACRCWSPTARTITGRTSFRKSSFRR